MLNGTIQLCNGRWCQRFEWKRNENHEKWNKRRCYFPLSPLWCYVFFLRLCCSNGRIVEAITGPPPPESHDSPLRRAARTADLRGWLACRRFPPCAMPPPPRMNQASTITSDTRKSLFFAPVFILMGVSACQSPSHIHSLDTVRNNKTTYSFFLSFISVDHANKKYPNPSESYKQILGMCSGKRDCTWLLNVMLLISSCRY